jgi:hypothetical protein
MGSLSTVFSAEVMAILRCTELLLTKNFTSRRTYICTNLDIQKGKNADCVDMKKKTVYTLCVTVLS